MIDLFRAAIEIQQLSPLCELKEDQATLVHLKQLRVDMEADPDARANDNS